MLLVVHQYRYPISIYVIIVEKTHSPYEVLATIWTDDSDGKIPHGEHFGHLQAALYPHLFLQAS